MCQGNEGLNNKWKGPDLKKNTFHEKEMPQPTTHEMSDN